MNFSKIAVRRPVSTLMIALAIVILGVVSLNSLTLELMPDFELPFAGVITVYPGGAPSDVEKLITEPIEKEMGTISNVKNITSISQENLSMINFEFEWGTDLQGAIFKMRDKIEFVKNQLPEGTQIPMVIQYDPMLLPLMQVSVHGKNLGITELTSLVNETISPRLSRVEGLASVEIAGQSEKEIQIALDGKKLEQVRQFKGQRGLTVESLSGIIQAQNLSLPVAEIEKFGRQLTVRASHKVDSPDIIENLVIGLVPVDDDQDGLPNYLEEILKTNPQNSDSDGDGYSDGEEIFYGYNPLIALPNDKASEEIQAQWKIAALSASPETNGETTPLHLKDVAEVNEIVNNALILYRMNGEQSVSLILRKEASANIVQVSGAIYEKLDEIKDDLKNNGSEVEFTPVMDQSVFIKRSLNDVSRNGFFGALLAVLVIFIFLRRLKPTFVIFLSIPLAITATFVLMYFADISFNILTLGAIALGIGMLVDNAIVVLENIFRYSQEGKITDKKQAAILGSSEVSGAIIASTLTTVAVFLPIAFAPGLISEFFKEFAYVIAFALFSSLFVALTIVPVLASKLFKKIPLTPPVSSTGQAFRKGENQILEHDEGKKSFFKKSQEKYKKIITWALCHRAVTLIIVFAVFGGSLLLFYFGLEQELSPPVDMGRFSVSIKMPAGTSLEKTDQVVKTAEEILNDYSEIEKFSSSIGIGIGMQSQIFAVAGGQASQAGIGVELVPLNERESSSAEIVEDFEKKFREKLASDSDEDGLNFGEEIVYGTDSGNSDTDGDGYKDSDEVNNNYNPLVVSPFDKIEDEFFKEKEILIAVSPEEDVMNMGSTIQYQIIGQKQEEIKKIADEFMEKMEEVDGVKNIISSLEENLPEINIFIDQAKATEKGLTPAQIIAGLRGKASDSEVLSFRENGSLVKVIYSLEKSQRDSLEEFKKIKIATPFGESVELEEIASFESGYGPTAVYHTDGIKAVTIDADAAEGRSLTAIMADIEEVRQKMEVPDGCEIKAFGQFGTMEEVFEDLAKIFILSIILIYIIMASQFESLLQPLIIMFSLPLAAIGIIFALFATGTTVSMISMTGVIVLAGIVVNNAIVLIDYVNQLRRRGLSVRDALIQGGMIRMRPIFMTAATTCLALVPLALGLGEGGEIFQPMAITIIGGLLFSTILTLIVIPVVYSVFAREKK
jgi:HAE1 family hydrophobic/amphiphilic exporter-1